MARLDYWNPAHIPTNMANRVYRNPPGGIGFSLSRDGQAPLLQRAMPENIYSNRYFPRDHKVRWGCGRPKPMPPRLVCRDGDGALCWAGRSPPCLACRRSDGTLATTRTRRSR
eukprot:5887547-Prymnesium_polylepis.1